MRPEFSFFDGILPLFMPGYFVFATPHHAWYFSCHTWYPKSFKLSGI